MKKLTRYSIFILIISLFSCKSNFNKTANKQEVNYIPYYLKVYEADSLFLTNNFKKSYYILDELFKKYEPIQMEGYYEYSNYVTSYAMCGHREKLKELIKNAYVKFGGMGTYRPNAYALRDSIVKISGLTKEEVDLFKAEYFKHINLDLRKRIEKICLEDQSVRMGKIDAEMKVIDEKNRVELEDILSKFGYPDANLIGSDNYFDNTANISVLFLHQQDSTRAKYLPLLMEYVKKGKCQPSVYATLYDRRKCDNAGGWGNCKQHYGAYTDSQGKISPPVENLEKIDSIRKSIGLYSVEYFKWRNNYLIENSK